MCSASSLYTLTSAQVQSHLPRAFRHSLGPWKQVTCFINICSWASPSVRVALGSQQPLSKDNGL